VKSGRIGRAVAPTGPGRERFLRINGADEIDIARVGQVCRHHPEMDIAQVIIASVLAAEVFSAGDFAARVLGRGWSRQYCCDQKRQDGNQRCDRPLRLMPHWVFPAATSGFATGESCVL